MCMIVDNPEPLIAEKPIRVWKILTKLSEDTYLTPIQLVEVKVGDTLHARNPDKPIMSYYKIPFGIIDTTPVVIDSQGVHAFQDKEFVVSGSFTDPNEVITEWEIPKGCKYWLQSDVATPSREIAATEMKFIKEL